MKIDQLTGRELDAAVAEGMGFIVRRTKVSSRLGDMIAYRVSSPKCRACAITMSFYSGNDFSLVKREIEQRGWDWQCWSKRDISIERFYTFQIYGIANTNRNEKIFLWQHIEIGRGVADSEETAGCRAFLKACEATKDKED